MGKDIGSEVYEITINGVSYTYGKPTLGARNEVVAWSRAEILRRATQAIEDSGLSGKIADRIMDSAVRRATTIALGTTDLAEFIQSNDGAARMLWACLKSKGSTTWEEFRRAFNDCDKEQGAILHAAMLRLVGLDPLSLSEQDAPNEPSAG